MGPRTPLSALATVTGRLALVGVAACADPAPPGHGEAWPEANALFHREARFIGADGAYSIDLGDDRILWLFGDTFVARDHVHPHEGAAFLRNSVGLQTGRDPLTATMRFYWRHLGPEGDALGSFAAEPAEGIWLWPGSGIRLDDTLVIFYGRLHNEGAPSPTSFRDEGWDARLVRNPDAEPDAWVLEPVTLPPDGGAGESLGEACVRQGDHVVVFGERGHAHAPTLARFTVAALAAGDLSAPERFCRGGWAVGCEPVELFHIGAPEYSVHVDARGRWVWIGGGGYGSTNITWRVADRPEGPWSDPTDILRPPESFADGAFVYAAKAHPELDGGDDALVVTYVPSGFDDFPAALDGVYYFPFFARVWLE